MIRFLITVFLLFLIDLYAYQAVQLHSDKFWLKLAFLGISSAVTLLCFYIYMLDREAFSNQVSNWIVGAFVTFMVTKLIIIGFLFAEDVFRLISYLFSYKEVAHMPARRKLLSTLALGVAAVPFSAMLYGVFRGKYRYKVLKHTLYFDDLPQAFDGYKMTHVSDFHCGSFDNAKKVKYGIDLINEQASDAIVFTGDLVNLKASEVLPWQDTLASLKAKDGVFSVLGNHDYGDYVRWNSYEEKQANFEELKRLQRQMGFNLLLNESYFIQRGAERLAIVGLENWGTGFIKKGDLNKATETLKTDDFSVVLSHDPSHWEQQILSFPKHLHLTLSGHTHGMQFGIEIPGWIKWSPIKYRYKQWAGIYEEAKKMINVNRGFGVLAFPGRTGIWPEITVLELKKKIV